jgi:hypothetical protein
LQSLHILYMFVLRMEIITIFELKMHGNNIHTQYKHIQNLQTLQGYIFQALYNFTTKCYFWLWCLIPFSLLRLKFSLTCKLSIS